MTVAARETAETVAAPGRLRRVAASPIALAFVGVVIFLGALALFRWGLDAAREVYFDETWYVPAARALLKTGEMTRQEHPPLGKLLIAASMALFGDNPIGWRAMSVRLRRGDAGGDVRLVAGAARATSRQALWATAATLCDGVLYVQSRAAMLDIFLMAFGATALALVTFSLKERHSRRRAIVLAILSGVCLGLASACKLSGVFLLAGIVAVYALIGLMRMWRARFDEPREHDFYASAEWPAMTLGWATIAFLRRAVRRLFPRLSAADDPRRNAWSSSSPRSGG